MDVQTMSYIQWLWAPTSGAKQPQKASALDNRAFPCGLHGIVGETSMKSSAMMTCYNKLCAPLAAKAQETQFSKALYSCVWGPSCTVSYGR